MTEAGSLYFGKVVHKRLRPFTHRFDYRVFSLLVDLDALGNLDRSLRLFGHNRPALMSLYDKDHGARDGSPLRPWVDRAQTQSGLPTGGRIRLLCFPRLFGYVFNPLSIYFCDAPDGRLQAILYEVKNTFGDQHGYLVPVAGDEMLEGTLRGMHHSRDKRMYVSPFIDMDAHYAFRLRPPGERLNVAIHESQGGAPILFASLTGRAAPLDDATLLRAFLGNPLMTLKVIAGIHWEALQLWRKGAPYFRRGTPPKGQISLAGHDLDA